MRQIKQIRDLNEMDDSQIRKLTTLARAGLFDPKKLNFIKRALDKDVNKMTPADKKALIELLDSLMAEVLGSSQVYAKVKQEVMHESKDYLSKYDPRFDKNYPSDRELPQIIILKRKAIRVYPDSQKVGLYYSQALDKYVSIPFGPGIPVVNEETELNELSKGTYASAAWKATQKAQKLSKAADDEKDEEKKKKITALQTRAKNLASKASEKIKKIETGEREEVKKKADAEKEAKGKIKRLEVNPVVGGAALAGVAAGKAIVKAVDKFRAKRAEKKAAQTKASEKSPEPKKDEAPKTSMSTSGKVSGKFATAQTASPSKITIRPKVQPKAEPKTEPSKSTSNDPPDDSGLAAASKLSSKTKTATYQSHSAQTIPNIKHGAPIKAGGVFLPPSHPSRSTSAQPNVKPKALKATLLKKMDEKRQEKIDEAVPLVPLAIGAARIAAPAIGRALATGARGIGRGLWKGTKAVGRTAGKAIGAVATAGSDKDSSGSSSGSDSDEPKLLKPAEFGALKVSTNKPKGDGINTALKARDTSLNRKVSQAAISESKMIKTLRSINEETALDIAGNKITINSTIAEKIIGLYESLNDDNKKKMNNMLNENNVDSFKKIISFAVGQA